MPDRLLPARLAQHLPTQEGAREEAAGPAQLHDSLVPAPQDVPAAGVGAVGLDGRQRLPPDLLREPDPLPHAGVQGHQSQRLGELQVPLGGPGLGLRRLPTPLLRAPVPGLRGVVADVLPDVHRRPRRLPERPVAAPVVGPGRRRVGHVGHRVVPGGEGPVAALEETVGAGGGEGLGVQLGGEPGEGGERVAPGHPRGPGGAVQRRGTLAEGGLRVAAGGVGRDGIGRGDGVGGARLLRGRRAAGDQAGDRDEEREGRQGAPCGETPGAGGPAARPPAGTFAGRGRWVHAWTSVTEGGASADGAPAGSPRPGAGGRDPALAHTHTTSRDRAPC